MQLQIMDPGGKVLEVPYICCYCGGRSDDLKTLEEHIAADHSNDHSKTHVGRQSSDDEDPDHMLLDGLVEVQIKEESEFLLPLDLSRKEPTVDPLSTVPADNSVWIKQEPPDTQVECDTVADPDLSQPLPKIRVASEAVLKAPVPPPLLLKVQSVGQQTIPPPPRPFYTFGETTDNLMRENVLNIPNEGMGFPSVRGVPPMIALPRFPFVQRIPQVIPQRQEPIQGPKPRMPNNFPQAPYLLEVPFTCYHCGGRSSDLDTLKTHIETMHNPDLLFRQKLAADAKKRLLESITDNKVVKIKIPKPPKPQKMLSKESKVSVKDEDDDRPNKVNKLIIKVPKPFKAEDSMKMKKLKERENSRFKCPFCTFGGNSFRGLILHAKVKHEAERALKRAEMMETASSAQKLQFKKSFFCLLCDYKSISKVQVKKHMYAIHGKEKQYHCPYCTFRTAYGENIRWHIMKHKFKCSNCEFRSTTKANILEHEQTDCSGFFNVINVSPMKPPRAKKGKRGRKPKSTKVESEPPESCTDTVTDKDNSSNKSLSQSDLSYNANESSLANDVANPIETNSGEENTENKTITSSGEPLEPAKNDIENSDTSNIVTNEINNKMSETENNFTVQMVAS